MPVETQTTALTGHAPQVKTLLQMLAEDRLPHALCFAGPEGIGKRTLACLLVGFDICEQKPSSEQLQRCGQCPGCKKFAGASHPDLVFVEPDGATIKIDQVRDILQQVRFHPLFAKRRWIIIDQADRLTEQAQNALLRTLEEPNEHTHFILIVEAFDQLLQTIRSRSQLVRFSTLPASDVTAVLDAKGVTPEHLVDALALAHGAPGRALAMGREEVFELRKTLLRGLAKLAAEKQPAQRDMTVFLLSQALSAEKNLRPFVLETLQSVFRDLALRDLGVSPSEWTHPDLAMIWKEVPGVDIQKVLLAYDKIRRMERDFRVNVNAELTFNHALGEIAEVFHEPNRS